MRHHGSVRSGPFARVRCYNQRASDHRDLIITSCMQGRAIMSNSLRFGIYASIGTSTCTGHTAGSMDHEIEDVRLFASFGVDYIKAEYRRTASRSCASWARIRRS
jgi:hypothetical protein